MHQQVQKPNPDWNREWKILGGIKIRGPFIQVEPLRAHEIGTISKNDIMVFNWFKHEDEESSTNKVIVDAFGD